MKQAERQERYNQKVRTAEHMRGYLASKYKTSICDFDLTAVVVSDVSGKQHSELCRKLSCSGTYNEERRAGILLNFGEYK
jgi:hypothetical protein